MKEYKHFTQEERYIIYEELQKGTSKTKIARILGRDKSTIGRELKRNKDPDKPYLPDTAHNKAKERTKQGYCKIEENEDLKQHIIDHLVSFKWSPEQIAGRLKFEQNPLGYACAETIYAWIYSKEQKDKTLKKFLKRHKAKRGLRKAKGASASRIPGRVSIHDRPAIINDKKQFGHFEGDLMSYQKNSQHMLVLRERKTAFVMSVRLPNKTAQATSMACEGLLTGLPRRARRSCTFDNGGEFTNHGDFAKKLKMKTFFCDAYKSWQKGGVENANGQLRHDLPRKTDLLGMKAADFEEVILNYNTTPKKALGFKTPLEVWNENLRKAA